MLQTEVDKGDILRPVILDATELISERNKCSHQCFLSALELLKLRLRVLVVQREDVEQYARSDEFSTFTKLRPWMCGNADSDLQL